MNTKNIALRTTRKEVGMTQLEVAKKARITERAYQKYEYGVDPGVKVAIRIAEALGIQSFDKFKDLFGAATPKEDRGNDTSKE